MSRKLIAVASASALALSALVALPAAAVAPSAAITTFTSGAGTASSPYLIPVPSANSIAATTNAVTLTLEVTAGDVVTVASTGTVKFTEAEIANSSLINVTNLGVQQFSSTRTTADDVELFVYNTSTTAGTITATITNANITSTKTFYIKGTVGLKYNIVNVTGIPATLGNGLTSAVSFEITDALGNKVPSVAGITATNFSAPTWDVARNVYTTTLTSPSATAFLLDIDLGAVNIPGFADAADSFKAVVNSPGVSDTVASLTAQVAALQAQVDNMRTKARSVTKKRWNNLVKRHRALGGSAKLK